MQTFEGRDNPSVRNPRGFILFSGGGRHTLQNPDPGRVCFTRQEKTGFLFCFRGEGKGPPFTPGLRGCVRVPRRTLIEVCTRMLQWRSGSGGRAPGT